MAVSRPSFAAAALVFVAMTWSSHGWAHNVERVRRELFEQGYEQLEFSRSKPPFKLDACRDGQKFHLHVDYYGKVTEQTPIGPCGEDAARVPTSEPSSVAAPAVAPPSAEKPASSADKSSPDESELCARYFPELGKTVRVPCD